MSELYTVWVGAMEVNDEYQTLENAEKLASQFTERGGDDAEYKIAQLLRSSVRDAEKYGLDDSKHTGWGILPMDNDAGEAFEYVLHKDGNVSFKSI
jgi:hypothetical protein